MKHHQMGNQSAKTLFISCCALLMPLLVFAGEGVSHDSVKGKLDSLINGLHRDAHEGNFDTYFAR